MSDEKKNKKKEISEKEVYNNKKKDNKDFQKDWGKVRKNGKVKYILNNSLKIMIPLYIIIILYTAIIGKGTNPLINSFTIFISGLIGYAIGSLITWNKNEKKYALLSSKKLKK